ncbi:hypothetical protein QVD17_20473 [Tagetes erecta]|uniref:Uncharacterized protein n=1 Tax=Tagetes erecta TaxID=13708 RepID=A0AAD8KLR9_TARER|nr:hypothetical protein QVD17_20473 [Tagetes erecta]
MLVAISILHNATSEWLKICSYYKSPESTPENLNCNLKESTFVTVKQVVGGLFHASCLWIWSLERWTISDLRFCLDFGGGRDDEEDGEMTTIDDGGGWDIWDF